MSLNQIIDQDYLSLLVCDDTLRLKGNTLRLKTNLEVPNGDFDNVNTNTINSVPYPPGGGFLPVAVPNKILRTDAFSTISWGDVNPSNLVGGTTGQVIRTIAPSTVAWDNLIAGDITPGTTNQVMVTNFAGTAALWSNDVVVPGTLKVDGASEIQGPMDIQDDLQFNGMSGTSGQYLKKTGAITQAWTSLAAGDLAPGTANQVLQTDPTGTAVVWNSNVVVPGTISTNFNITGGTVQSIGTINSVNGGLTLSNVAAQINMLGAGTQINCGGVINTVTLNMTGALQFSAVSGTLGAVPVSNALGIPSWSFPTYFVRYYNNSIVNMNSGGGTTLLTAATADVSNANITYLAGTFTLAEPGQYQVVFQTNPTSVSAKAQSYVKLIVNGVSRGSVLNASAALNDVQSLSLIKTFRVNTTNATVAITTQQFVAGTLNTSGVDVDGIPTTLITITRLGPYV